MKLVAHAIDNYRATLAILLLVIVVGVMARVAMTIEVNPNVQIPVVLISIRHDGISPEDGTRLLVRPVEKELKTLEGLEEIRATARESAVYITVEFDIERDLRAALADTREAVSRATAEFPDDTKEPLVSEIPAIPEPTVVVNFSGDNLAERDLYNAARFFQRQIETLPDVLKASMSGHRKDVVEVELDPARLQKYQFTGEQIIASVAANNLLIPAGELDAGEGRFPIKLPALLETVEDIRALPLGFDRDHVLTLGDIATVRRSFEDPVGFSFLDGRQTIALDVRKRTKANAIETVEQVRALIDKHRDNFPGVNIDYFFDTSDNAAQLVGELSGNIVTAMCLVLVLVIAALGVRSGVLVGIGIPFSLLGAMIVIHLFGYSFNFMVMFGLLLALGMLIDGAIVVVEFANAEMAEGSPPRTAYLSAVRRMAVPVIASTGTTLAAFLPLLFWPGVSGNFMRYLPVTVFAVLFWSLAYALLFAPTLGVLSSPRQRAHGAVTDIFASLQRGYLRLLQPVVDRAISSALVALFLLVSIFWGYGKYGVGQEFFTTSENQYGVVTVRALGNLSVEEKARLTLAAQAMVKTVPEVARVYASSQGSSAGSDRSKSRDEIAELLVELVPGQQRNRASSEIFADVRRRARELPGIYVTGKQLENGPPVGKDIQIQLSADDRALLHSVARTIRAWMKANLKGIRDLEDTLPLAGIEWEIQVDRARAAMLGVNVNSVGQMVQMVTNGIKIGEYRPDDADEEVEIRLRYPSEDRTLAALDDLRVNTLHGPVPVSSFTQRVARPRVDTIQRIDLSESVFVMANTEDGFVTDLQVAELTAWLETANLSDAVSIQFRGANEEQEESAEFLSVAFSLAMFLMLIMLVAQFNSFYQAFLILFTVVMATAGVLFGLLVAQNLFSTILTGVGIVALAGIVVNNNIVLIDSFNYLRKNHPEIPLADAAVEAARSRFRPVLLTTVTTVAGLLPLANSLSVDIVNRALVYGGETSSWWQPLASAIVNGLLFSTVMTLLVTPAMLVVPQRIREYRKARRQDSQDSKK